MIDLESKISSLMPEIRADLERLIRIPSCGFDGFDPKNVRKSAEAVAGMLSSSGLHDTRLVEIPGGHPAVFGHTPGPPGTATVLLYAHHDVQPPGPDEEWDSPPYEPTERDGRLFGRGSSDDKCGVAMHLAALRAFDGKPPVGVKVIVEGEEECTAEHLPWLFEEHAELLRADAVVIADSGVWKRGVPALTASIRGVVATKMEVRVADQSMHSGVYGGPVPDAITALSRMIASLHDDDGNVAVKGLLRRPGEAPVDYDEKEFREEAKLRPGVELLGQGALADRLWFGPSINIVGMDAPSIRDASFQVVPVATAFVTMRIAPGENAHDALQKLEQHLLANAPWGVDVAFAGDERATGHEMPTEGPVFEAAVRSLREAWGVEPVLMGMGGSVPLVPELAKAMPDAIVLLTGPGDELSAAHSVNESVDLKELERSCLAEARFLQILGAG
ncbi:MAG: M20/M25/M40 family metallo-hydrolase [Actinomycetota bacterium]